jgi:methionyl-tRNA formyltransferase
MLATVSVPIGADATTVEVEAELAHRGAELLVSTLDAIEAGSVVEIAQDDAKATYAPKLTKAESPIDWTRTAAEIHNQVRGLWPWPHASTFVDGVRYIVHRSRVSDVTPGDAAAGTVIRASAPDGLHVACGAGTSLELLEIQLEGKRVMAARDALAGGRLTAGVRFSPP